MHRRDHRKAVRTSGANGRNKAPLQVFPLIPLPVIKLAGQFLNAMRSGFGTACLNWCTALSASSANISASVIAATGELNSMVEIPVFQFVGRLASVPIPHIDVRFTARSVTSRSAPWSPSWDTSCPYSLVDALHRCSGGRLCFSGSLLFVGIAPDEYPTGPPLSFPIHPLSPPRILPLALQILRHPFPQKEIFLKKCGHLLSRRLKPWRQQFQFTKYVTQIAHKEFCGFGCCPSRN